MLVEGILILTHPELRELFDIMIYVHADSDERLVKTFKTRYEGARARFRRSFKSLPNHT